MLVWPHQMYLTGITAGIILQIISGFWNVWTMCVGCNLMHVLPSATEEMWDKPALGRTSPAQAVSVTQACADAVQENAARNGQLENGCLDGHMSLATHSGCMLCRSILVLFYLERKNYMIKLGANFRHLHMICIR